MKVTRREFLRMSAVAAGAAAGAPLLAACGGSAAPYAITRRPPPTPGPGETYLAVARGGDDPEALVRRAVAAVGGMERFVRRGANVLVKPNVCAAGRSYEYAATTNPWVVAAVVKLCREAGAGSVRVYDNPFSGSAEEAMASSGIAEAAQAAGAEIDYPAEMKFVSVGLPAGETLKQTRVYDGALNADALINVPILKHHSLAQLTVGMKNSLGLVRDRPEMHASLNRKLVDLNQFLLPTLTIVDAVRILRANGPTGGNPADVEKLDAVVATHDPVAADAYAATLFGWEDPERLPCVKYGAERGLGRSDLADLDIEEIPVGG
ncbi:MAG: DUF362 domain-containing protein [Anaerolineales bacterium]|nr:DUF362 domain-containing protein [Anaerolineales bacterium]